MDEKPTKPEIVTKAELARRCGVTRQSVNSAFNKAVTRGEAIKGQKDIDLSADWVQEYMASCGVRLSMIADTPPVVTVAAPQDATSYNLPPAPAPFNRLEMENRKLAAEVHKIELDNGKKERSLVDRKLVERMIGSLDRATNMIIMDGTAKLVPELYAEIKGSCKCGEGCTIEEAQKYYYDKAGKYISPVKPEMIRALKRYDREN